MIPPPAVAEPAGADDSEVAVLAGGCFWGVQGVFQHVKGVTNAVSGYAGGDKKTAQYETVEHAARPATRSRCASPSIRARSAMAASCRFTFSVAHDPTELNRQGPDVGTQYRSAIFPTNAEQAQVAKAYIAQLNQAHVVRAPRSSPRSSRASEFFPAEDYHQDFLTRHPDLSLHRL